MLISLPYVLLVFALGVLAYFHHYLDGDKELQQRLTGGAVALFLVFFGFRGFILSDWIVYYQYFYDCQWNEVFSYELAESKGFEPGFAILTMMCKTLFPDFHFYTFLLCAINTALLLRFFRNRTDNIPLSIMLYVVFEGLVISTNLMRNSIAIFLFLNAIDYLIDRKPLQYFSLCLLACTFHLSAFVYLPLYFFFHRNFSKWFFLVVFVVCNVIYLSHFSLFEIVASLIGLDESMTLKVRTYTELYSESSRISIGYLEKLMTGTLIFLYYDELKDFRKGNVVFINAVLAYLAFFFVLGEFEMLARRVSMLFVFGYWIIWSDLIRTFSFSNNRKLFGAFVFLYCLLRINGLTQLPDFEYDNVLTGIKSYNERYYLHNKTYDGP